MTLGIFFLYMCVPPSDTGTSSKNKSTSIHGTCTKIQTRQPVQILYRQLAEFQDTGAIQIKNQDPSAQ